MVDKISSGLDGITGFRISSKGKSIGNNFGLLSFKISREINKIGKALLVFEAGDMPKGLVSESDNPAFDVGNPIKIEAGYGNDLKCIFEGIVVYHTVDIASENNTTLQVECREMPFKATQSKRYEIFRKKSDNQIIKDVLGKGEYNLTVKVKGAEIKHLQYYQIYTTDWETIMSRAKDNGLVVIVDGKNVNIAPLETKDSNESLEYGTNIIEFKAKLNTTNLYKKVVVESLNSKNKKVLIASSDVKLNQGGDKKDIPCNDTYRIRTTENIEKSTLEIMAKAEADQMALAKILGSCKFCGRAEIQIGKPIALKGFGKRFEGDVFINSLEHDFNEDGWTTTVNFGIPLDNKNSKQGSPIQLKTQTSLKPDTQGPANNPGLQIAVVTKLTDDPDKEFKIEVKIPDSSGKEMKLWARLSNFWSSNSYGAFFIPEVNDEVILGFFNNDPAHPVILGSLYSSSLPPSNKLTEQNNIQSITTKSKIKLEFDDKKKVITIETPGKNIIKISDEDKGISLTDQNKNKIELNDNGITLESAKGIILKSKTDIKIEAGTALEAKAKTDLKLEGMNVEGKAKTMLKMKGSASAEFSASGNTTIKGAMVMIN